MKKNSLVFILLIAISLAIYKPALAQDDRTDKEQKITLENESNDDEGVVVKPPIAAITTKPTPLWNNPKDRGNEFLSKTPQQRREIRRLLQLNKKAKLTPTRLLPKPATRTLKGRFQPLWDAFWSLFRKPISKP